MSDHAPTYTPTRHLTPAELALIMKHCPRALVNISQRIKGQRAALVERLAALDREETHLLHCLLEQARDMEATCAAG